nr:hypothetical protein [Tanacetum cinerariifolium]
MDQQYPTVAKIPVLDTGKFEQWQFRIQQYLQHEHYALWEVIEFKDSYTVPANSPSTTTTDTTSGDAGTKSGRTVTLIAEDMQKKKNYVKARTTLLLSLSDEHQLRFKWLMHTIVWRNRSDLDTMSLDDLCNHLKVYESEVQKKSEPNSQNMAFISSAKHSSGNEDGNTARVPTASASVATISQDTACAYIASQSSGSQIKFEDINQIDEDDIEEMDIKWNMALLSMRADKFWKNTVKKISIQGSDVAGFDKSKEEKEGVDGKLAGLLKASKDIDNLIESQRPSPTVESTSGDDQNRNPSVSETVASPITPKPFIKFVKPKDSKSKSKTGKIESPKKPPVKNFLPVNRKFSTGSRNFPIANRKFPIASRKFPTSSTKCSTADMGMKGKAGSSQNNIDDKGYWDSGCSKHITGNISYLSGYEPFDGGYVSFGQGGCKITGKRTIKT